MRVITPDHPEAKTPAVSDWIALHGFEPKNVRSIQTNDDQTVTFVLYVWDANGKAQLSDDKRSIKVRSETVPTLAPVPVTA